MPRSLVWAYVAQMQANEIVFIVNPNSGRALHPRTLTALCHAACDGTGRVARVVITTTPQEAAVTARQAHESGAAAIFGCGGDGTLSSILQGLPVGSSTALGAVPLGTANVWAYETNLPATPMAAISAQLAALDAVQGHPLWIDTGKVWSTRADGSIASRRFLLMASWGLDAAAVEGCEHNQRRRRLKRWIGEPAYFVSAVQEALLRSSWPMSISIDGAVPFTVEAAMMTAGNTRMIGTWAEINPKATVVDGRLDLMLIEGAPWRAIALTPLTLAGWLAQTPGVRHLSFQRLEATPLRDAPPMQIDGELGPATAYAIDIEPNALKVLCPVPTSEVLGG